MAVAGALGLVVPGLGLVGNPVLHGLVSLGGCGAGHDEGGDSLVLSGL